MRWPTWTQALVAAAIAGLLAVTARRLRPTRVGDAAGAAAMELAFVATLYAIWRMAKNLPLTRADGALERGLDIARLQQWMHLPSELSLQQFVLDHEWLARFSAWYYAAAHVPALIVFLVWLYARHGGAYRHWRNGLVFVTAGCLFIRFVKVAPPRYLPELGFVDVSAMYGMDVYGQAGTGVSSQFAAMPSLHVGWAAVIAFGALAAASTSRWRWIGMGHLALTAFVVAATGHHWWLDGVVAVALLAVGLQLDTWARRLLTPPPVELTVPTVEREAV